MDQTSSADYSAKLTNWSKEPTLNGLKGDLEAAKPYHDSQSIRIDNWNNALKVEGIHKPKAKKGRSQVQPKLIRRQNEWRYSALTEPFLSNDNLYKVSPTTFEDTEGAKQNEILLNWQWRTKLNRIKFVDDFVRSAADDGTVIIQVGWCRKTIKMKKKVPVYKHLELTSEEELEQFKQALEAKQTDPRSFKEQASPEIQAAIDFYEESGQASTAVQSGWEEQEFEKVVENHPTADIREPKNVFIDPSCDGDFTKAMFVVVSFETSFSELKKYPKRYKNLNKIDWEGNTPLAQPEHDTKTPDTFNFKDAARKKVVAYEYWGYYDIDGKGELTPIVATWIGNTLIRMERNPFPDEKLPFVLVPYLPVKRQLYGETDAELLEDNQKILGAVTRGMIDLLGRSANAQQGFAKGMLDPLNRRRFENGDDYEFNPNMPPQNGMVDHKYPEFPQSAFQMLSLQNQEAEALTGVKSFSGGISGEAYGEVAAGIRGVLDAASKREMAILRRLAHGFVLLGKKFISMNAVFMSEQEVIRVTNRPYVDIASVGADDKNQDEFVTIRREDIQGEYDLKVDISTAEVDDAQAKDLAFMLQTIGNNMDPSFTVMILAEIARLKKMPDLEHKLKMWKPQVDPIQEELKKLELEKIKLELQELRSKAVLNEAKAKQALAAANQTEIDTDEQVTGLKHGREMEKQQAQAEGNQRLEITKALTKPAKQGEKKPDVEAAIGFNELSRKLDGIDHESAPIDVDNTLERDELAETDPRFSLGSRFYDPNLDPASNPNLTL